jgi:hypothetical protein
MARDYSIASNPRQIFLESVALQRAEQDRRAKLERQKSLQTDLAALMEKPDTQSFASFYLKYPEAKEQVEGYRKMMDEGDQKAILEASQTAFILNRENRPEDVNKLFDERIEALKNSKRPALAQTFERAKATYNTTTDPKAREAVLSTIIYNYGGGEAHEKIFGTDVKLDTSIIKNLIAEGLEPGSPEFKEALKRDREKISVNLPNGGFFSGTPDELQAILGGRPMPTNVQKGPLPKPKTKADFDRLPVGASYEAPDGSIRTKPGGQTATPSGNFQGK